MTDDQIRTILTIERGVPSLSPAGRGLRLLAATYIERGEHRREGDE